MKASMARRIRNAESILITAIDRERHRDWSRQAQPAMQRTAVPAQTERRTGALHSHEQTRKVA